MSDQTPTASKLQQMMQSPAQSEGSDFIGKGRDHMATDAQSLGGQSAGAASLKLDFSKLKLTNRAVSSAPESFQAGPNECPLCLAIEGATMDPVYKQRKMPFLRNTDGYCRLAFGLTGAAKKGMTWTDHYCSCVL